MTTKSFAKETPSKESKRWPLWVAASATLATVFVGLFFYFFVCSSSSPFHAIQNKHGGFLIASLFCTIALSSSFLAPLMLLIKFLQYKEKKYRLKLVLACAAIGAFFVTGFVYFVETSSSKIACIIKDNDLLAPIFLLIVSAPLSLYLWSCRNEDKLEQIKQTNVQNSLNRLSNAMQFLLEKTSKHANAAGLKILAKIKSESDTFNAEIDMATSGANLEKIDLTKANLTGVDLSRATLIGAFLTKAKLLNVNLMEANLTDASMFGADLTEANLQDAILNDIVVGVRKKHLYKGGEKNIFSRAEIENYLKKDLEKRKTYAQVKEKEKNKSYYFQEMGGIPPSAPPGSPPSAPPGSPPSAPPGSPPSAPPGSPPSTPPDSPPSAPPGSPPSTPPGSPPSAPPGSPPSASPSTPPASAFSPDPAPPVPAPVAPPPAPSSPKDPVEQGKMLYYGVKSHSPTFDEAIEKNPHDPDAYFNRGKAKLEINDFDGAIKDFDKAIKLDLDHAGAYRLRAFAKLRKGME